MKKSVKKTILTIIAVIALVLMTGDTNDSTMQILWTLGWGGVLAGCCRGLERLGAFNK